MTDTFECEWSTPKCHDPAIGYVGGGNGQHPLCERHLDPKWMPVDLKRRLVRGPITTPCEHAKPFAEATP